MRKDLLVLTITIIAISLTVFLLIPNALETLAFSGQEFLGGEVWRIITFSFVHISWTHLIENIITLIVTALLSYEFGLRGKHFIYTFVLSGVLIALSQVMLAPLIILAGASLGIYAVLGSISIKGSTLISEYILIPVLGLSVFLKFIFSLITYPEGISMQLINQSFLHFFGFLSGIILFYIFIKYDHVRKTSCLRKITT